MAAPFDFVTLHVDTRTHPGPENVLESDLDYLQLIDLMFQSALRFHPGARATILTDRATDLAPLRTAFRRSEHAIDPHNLMLDRSRAQLRYLEDWNGNDAIVLLDSDILINGTLDHLLEQDFDVAVTWRPQLQMPVNAGFMLLQARRPERVRALFRRFVGLFADRFGENAGWYGDQFALRDLLGLSPEDYPNHDTVEVDGCRIRLLPCSIYNFSPRNRTRAVLRPLEGPRVLHFNGSRKRLMRLYAEAHLSGHFALAVIARYYLRRRAARWFRRAPARPEAS